MFENCFFSHHPFPTVFTNSGWDAFTFNPSLIPATPCTVATATDNTNATVLREAYLRLNQC